MGLDASELQRDIKDDLYAQCLSIFCEVFSVESDSADVIFKALLGLGTAIVLGSTETKTLANDLELKVILQGVREKWNGKLGEKTDSCLTEVLRLF